MRRSSNREVTSQSHLSRIAGSLAMLAVTAVALGLWSGGATPGVTTQIARTFEVEDFDPSYLDRSRIGGQSGAPTGLISQILSPSLGFPRRIRPGEPFSVFLAGPLANARLVLLPRSALEGLDRVVYAIPARGDAPAVLSRRLDESGLSREPSAISEDAGRGVADKCAEVALDDVSAARRRVTDVRAVVEASIARASIPVEAAKTTRLPDSRVVRLEVQAPSALEHGLYAIALVDGNRLVDVQLNAVYFADEATPFRFVVAADLQWGDSCAVVGSVLRFVSMMNGLVLGANAAQRPEFVIIGGDVVDASFASAGSFFRQLFVGADYSRDYLQAWLALAALRLPVYVLPGNHDGYLFEGALGTTASDGLLLFESTFGPLYYSVDRPPFRFLCENSYDLPPRYRSVRRSDSSSFLERLSTKFNVLNWGGGMRWGQYRWMRRRLGLDGGERPPHAVVVLHHDPRGSYPAVRPVTPGPDNAWTRTRHFPITAAPGDRRAVFASAVPTFSDTIETHVGYFTPLRDPHTAIRVGEWFDLGIAPAMPPTQGFPGWIRFQQGWHSNFVYSGGLEDSVAFDVDPDLVPPNDILATLVAGRVREIFKGHDNRFARATLRRGESILGDHAAKDLARWATVESRDLPPEWRLTEDLAVYHTADVADVTSEGHGYLWVEASSDSLRVTTVQHRD